MSATKETGGIPYELFKSNFPFETLRSTQADVLKGICEAYNSGVKVIVLEAPTGFGKSPVAMAVARTLGSSYICSASKDLQDQYVRDFPFLRPVKGMNNYSCLVKEDFIENKSYACGKCGILDQSTGKKVTNQNECNHKIVEYGPCRGDHIAYKHNRKMCELCQLRERSTAKFHDGCRYRTFPEDYNVEYANSSSERVEISDLRKQEYQLWYKTNGNDIERWMHSKNFDNFESIRSSFTPCPYYDQLNKGLVSSHSIFNYANLITFMQLKPKLLPERNLLILDEGHSIENQLVDQIGITLSIRILRKYILSNAISDLAYNYSDSIEKKWLPFLCDTAHQLDNAIAELESVEVKLDAMKYLRKINQTIEEIQPNPKNWIVSNLELENGKVTTVEFKPLDISRYCKMLFEKCKTTLIMSATILDIDSFCKNVGLDRNVVGFIRAGSEFPVQNRPIYPFNVAYLNFANLQQETIQRQISMAISMIMDEHRDEKGIIHCTSYAQVRFIEKFIDSKNKNRLLFTDPERPNSRDDSISEHFSSPNPTVLISPSLHTGIDLKDERSRFQIIVKLPYPSRNDRWIEAKRMLDGGWYNWQTSIKLIQAYGRSVRSKQDWAKTYVLDSGFGMFVSRNILPKWFTQAIVEH